MMKAMGISLDPLLVAPALVWFEVMDKEPALAQRAVLYGVLSAVGRLLSRKRWWLGLLVLPVVAVFAWAEQTSLSDNRRPRRKGRVRSYMIWTRGTCSC